MAGAYEAFGLGLGDPVPLSAEHGEGMADLAEALLPFVARAEDEDEAGDGGAVRAPPAQGRHRRPPERRQVDADQPADRRGPAAGRPRGRHHPRLDLPRLGLARARRSSCSTRRACGKRARVDDKLEKLSVADALRAVRFAEVVVVLLDATIPFEKQDLPIVDLVEQEGRALVIGLNKWDLVADQPGPPEGAARGGHAPAAAGARRAGGAALGARRRGLDRLMQAVSRPTRSGTAASRPRGSTTGSPRRSRPTRRPPSRAGASRSAT